MNVVDLNRISSTSNNWNKHSRLANTGTGFDTSLWKNSKIKMSLKNYKNDSLSILNLIFYFFN